MEFVPERTRLLEMDLERARGLVPRYRLHIPMLFRPCIAVLVYEGCGACSLALAHAMVLEEGGYAKVVAVDCSEVERRGGLAERVCRSVEAFPTMLVGEESEVMAALSGSRARVALVEGITESPQLVADALLSAFILYRIEDATRVLSEVLREVRRRGLSLVPDPLRVKRFVVELLRSLDRFGEPRCPCRPRARCPCPEGLEEAESRGSCRCGFVVRVPSGESALSREVLGSLSALVILAGYASTLAGDPRIFASVSPDTLCKLLAVPLISLPPAVERVGRELAASIDRALRDFVDGSQPLYRVVGG